MNLFYLDRDIDKCAEYHMDVHVTKMQLELAQMLSTNLWVDEVVGFVPRKVTSGETAAIQRHVVYTDYATEIRYKPCYINHPCTIWMRSSYENWEYSWLLVDALNQEAQWRGFNAHKSAKMVLQLPVPSNMDHLGFTEPAQAMPTQYQEKDTVNAYRNYYMGEKSSIAGWTRRGEPEWWVDGPINPNIVYQLLR